MRLRFAVAIEGVIMVISGVGMYSKNTAFSVWYAHHRTCNYLLIFLNTHRIIKLLF